MLTVWNIWTLLGLRKKECVTRPDLLTFLQKPKTTKLVGPQCSMCILFLRKGGDRTEISMHGFVAFGVRKVWVPILAWPTILALWPWAIYFISLSFILFICKVGLILPTSYKVLQRLNALILRPMSAARKQSEVSVMIFLTFHPIIIARMRLIPTFSMNL